MDVNKILKLKQFKAIDLEEENGEVLIIGELQKTDKHCPECNTLAIKPHQYHPKRLRTAPFNEMPTYLVFTHTAYLCNACGRRFLERAEFFEKQRVYTIAYEEYLWKHCKKQDIENVAKAEGLCWGTVNEIFSKAGEKEERAVKSVKYKA
jgi:transposase